MMVYTCRKVWQHIRCTVDNYGCGVKCRDAKCRDAKCRDAKCRDTK